MNEDLKKQMPRLTDKEVASIITKHAPFRDWVARISRAVAQAQREADAKWIQEQGLVRLPSEEEQKQIVSAMCDVWEKRFCDGTTDPLSKRLLHLLLQEVLRWLRERG